MVGIDSSDLFVARTGVRGANDLVWVGRAANYAAKLATLPDSYPTYITQEVYGGMLEIGRTTSGRSMWDAVRWETLTIEPSTNPTGGGSYEGESFLP